MFFIGVRGGNNYPNFEALTKAQLPDRKAANALMTIICMLISQDKARA